MTNSGNRIFARPAPAPAGFNLVSIGPVGTSPVDTSRADPSRVLANRVIGRLASLLAGLFLAGNLQAGQLDSYFDGVTTIQAGFTQTVIHSKDKSQTSKGKLYVASPDRFRLDYLEPYSQLYIADGKTLTSYDEDLEQVIIKPQGEMLTNTPAMVLSNPKQLDQDYKVEYQGRWDGRKWYLLTPKRQDTNFEQLRLGFENKRLKMMELKDSFGQFNRLVFDNVQYNKPLPKKVFSFVPPEGVDIIKE